jgi:hypothetical protein
VSVEACVEANAYKINKLTQLRMVAYDVIEFLVKDAPKPKDRASADTAALNAIQLALPIIAISPRRKLGAALRFNPWQP